MGYLRVLHLDHYSFYFMLMICLTVLKKSFHIFADDTNVFYSCKNLLNLESTMNEQFKLKQNYCAINNQ